MVLILDGDPEIGAHWRSNSVIFKGFEKLESSHKSDLFPQKYLFSLMRTHHILSYHLTYVSWPRHYLMLGNKAKGHVLQTDGRTGKFTQRPSIFHILVCAGKVNIEVSTLFKSYTYIFYLKSLLDKWLSPNVPSYNLTWFLSWKFMFKVFYVHKKYTFYSLFIQ